MRYMGQLGLEQVGIFAGPIDPEVKNRLMAAAREMPDDRAKELLDICDATKAGEKQKMMRFGIGAGVGLALGLVVGKLLRR